MIVAISVNWTTLVGDISLVLFSNWCEAIRRSFSLFEIYSRATVLNENGRYGDWWCVNYLLVFNSKGQTQKDIGENIILFRCPNTVHSR